LLHICEDEDGVPTDAAVTVPLSPASISDEYVDEITGVLISECGIK
jgi:hypothetical protein